MTPACVREVPGGTRLQLRVIPNAVKPGIAGLVGERLKIKLRRPAQDGRANTELLELLADRLGCRLSQVTIVHGETARQKVVEIRGLSPAVVARQLLADME
jgi:hypothetical protein